MIKSKSRISAMEVIGEGATPYNAPSITEYIVSAISLYRGPILHYVLSSTPDFL